MRKAFLSTLAVIALSTAAYAQGGWGNVSIGVKGGLSLQDVKFSNPFMNEHGWGSDSKTGFHVGVMGRIDMGMYHIQPEILYTHSGYKFERLAGHTPYNGKQTKININNVDIPILAGLRLLWFRFQAGPVINLMTDAKVKNADMIQDVEIDKATLGYMLGVGFDFGKINLDVRYNGQFRRPEQSVIFRDQQQAAVSKMKFRNWMFSVGYMF